MILEKIVARNIKEQSFEIPLSQAVAIVGPNFAGKSAVIEAIRLACIGFIPEIGKLPKSTWELSSGSEMEVSAEFSGKDGGRIQRRFFLKGESCQMQHSFWDVNGKPITDPNHPLVKLEPPLLNPEHYFGLTDTERTNYVFDRIRLPDTYSSDAIIAGIERISLGDDHSELVETAKRELIKELHEFFVGDAPIQQALAKSVEALREKFSYWNRRQKETQGAVTTLTELKLREQEVSAAPVNLDADMKAASAELGRINTEKGRVTAERDAAERNAGRRRQLQKLLDQDRIDYPRMLKQKQEEKQELETGLVPEPDKAEIEEARRTIASASSIISTADGDVRVADKVIGEIDTQLGNIEHAKECPYCKAKGKGWKQNLVDELSERKEGATTAIGNATKRRDKAAGELRDANETLETLVRAQESNHRLREQIRQVEREIGNIQTDQRAEGATRDRYTEELKEMPAASYSVKQLEAQIAHLEHDRVAVANKLSELNGRKQSEIRLQQDLLRAGEAEREHQLAKANMAVVKAVAEYLKQKKEAIICEAFTKLLQVANTLVKSIMRSPLVLHENTIGRFSGAKFVPHRVFSGTEKALAYIAIALALSQDSPCKLVMLDEFGRLDPANQAAVTSRLLNLVKEKVIDQFIIVGTHISKSAAGEGALQIIEVGQ